MPNDHESIVTDRGEKMEAMAPVIVSASRSTDVPAFYAEWFWERLKKGYSAWTNPFNSKTSFVSYAKTRFIVFWSKNPKPLLESGILDWLEERGIGCYVQFTLNDYEKEGLEKGVPPLAERIDTFCRLSDRLQKDGQPSGVIWRFDPMLLADRIENANGLSKITPEDLLEKARTIGDRLKGYTEKMVFSFADIGGSGVAYTKVQRNLKANGVQWCEFDGETMNQMAQGLSRLNKERNWNFTLATCGEKIDLESFGIVHNKCVDDELMIRRGYQDAALMRYWDVEIIESDLFDEASQQGAEPIKGTKNFYIRRRALKGKLKDSGQRETCGCAVSKDIGQYNTCPHLCEYCYANASKDIALANYKRHCEKPFAESILG